VVSPRTYIDNSGCMRVQYTLTSSINQYLTDLKQCSRLDLVLVVHLIG